MNPGFGIRNRDSAINFKIKNMKNLFLILLLGLGIWSCAPEPAPDPESPGLETLAFSGAPSSVSRNTFDTLSTSSSTDAFTLDLGSYGSPTEYDIQIQADSLSGGTTGTSVLQWSALGSIPTGQTRRWYNVTSGSTTINGVTTTDRKSGTIPGGSLRLSVTAGSSTQSTKVWADIVTSPRIPN